MTSRAATVVQRPVRDEPLVAGARVDYADAFEVRVPDPDDRTAEEWARAALERSPAVVRRAIVAAHRYLLRFRLAAQDAPRHVLGWRVVVSEPDVVQLEAVGPVVRGTIVGRRQDATSVVVTTFVRYDAPLRARLAWAVAGPLHRRAVPYLLTRAAGRTAR